MSYSKQQISDTARFIADTLFLESQEKLKAWFCRQFATAFKQYHSQSEVSFSAKDALFSELRNQLASKNVAIPDGFKVTLFQKGTSLCYRGKENEVIFPRKPVRDLKEKFNALMSMSGFDYDDEISDNELEAQFAPLQGQLVYSFAHLMPTPMTYTSEDNNDRLQVSKKSKFC